MIVIHFTQAAADPLESGKALVIAILEDPPLSPWR
jgi:hypothetical protein